MKNGKKTKAKASKTPSPKVIKKDMPAQGTPMLNKADQALAYMTKGGKY